jgi:DNA-directed RNA polymerase specialized sigma24 family protein
MSSNSSVGMEDLERRLRGGDQEALAELFSHERERLWRLVHFRLALPLRGRLGPEDVLQEAFLAASQRLKHYANSPATSPFIWLRMILNQTLIDLHHTNIVEVFGVGEQDGFHYYVMQYIRGVRADTVETMQNIPQASASASCSVLSTIHADGGALELSLHNV